MFEGREVCSVLASGRMKTESKPREHSYSIPHFSEHDSQRCPGRAMLSAQGHVINTIKYTQLEVMKQTKALTIFRQQESWFFSLKSIMLLITLLDHQLSIRTYSSSITTYYEIRRKM